MTAPDNSLRIGMLEDDAQFGELMRSWLADAGHLVHWETRAQGFMRLVSRETFDVILLDWRLPDGSGEDVLGWVRKNLDPRQPVIFITSRDSEQDVAQILDQGADDYLVKPVRRLELLARLRTSARRLSVAPAKDVIAIGNLRVDQLAETVHCDGVEIEMAPKEYAITVLLLRNLGRLLSRGQIYEQAWGRTAPDSLRTVDTHVSQVRTKLALTPPKGWKLTSVYQLGYRLEHIGRDGAATG